MVVVNEYVLILKKLLYITTNLNSSGGVSRILSVKVNYLADKYSYDIHILNTYNKTNTEPFYNFNKKINVHSLKRNYSFYQLSAYKKVINEKISFINPDIIINCDNGLKGALLPSLIEYKKALIFEDHSSHNIKSFNLKLKLKALFFYLNKTKYDYVVKLQNTVESPDKNIKVISNPLSFEIPNEKSNFENNTAIAVGRISDEKDYKTLLNIWSQVVKKYPNWILNIYGEGDKTELKHLMKNLELSNHVCLFDPISDIKERYLQSSMLLNTSKYESFGLTLIEALACGLPVVAFKDALDYKDYFSENDSVFLVENHDISAYVNMICSLIDDIKKNKNMFVNAKNSIRRFEQNIIMKQWNDLFQSIV